MNLIHAHEALKKYFGYETFRPNQAEIIQSVYEGKDAIVLMPTGGGKSICFQVPAVTMEGTCMVVSPLISLMKDQVEALRANGVRAAFLNSSLTIPEQRQVEDDLFYKRLDLLYVSPEKVCSRAFLPLMRSMTINLIAIDEAHCVSAWGHDFRPEYTRLKFLKKEFPNTPTLALTATADKMTRRDMATQLALRNAHTFIASFDRPNLSLEVRPGRKRAEQMIEFIKNRPNQSGIVYCLSRKNTESVCSRLLAAGIKADFYHAGMSDTDRSRVQEGFIKDDIPVICATVAFGMGIDKSNVRWVIHYNLPKNIEGYYQEIGRSGRDGAQADTLLFYSFNDVVTMRDILEKNDSEYKAVKLAKLDRMYQFATSVTCRRKVLLSYFGEEVNKDCGNCDVCKNPPEMIDGTIIVQKALSAVARLKENVASTMLIDVLRGSGRKDIFRFGYNQIKTYGAGREYSKWAWQHYLEQMLNQGLIEIAYDDHHKVKLTAASRAILFNGQKVQIVQPETVKKRREEEQTRAGASVRKKSNRQRVRDELFEYLRKLRIEVSRKKGVPPYIIFSDATLEEMAAERPKTMQEMNQISGVGEAKLREYGRAFLDAIQTFIMEKQGEGVRTKGSSYIVTLQLYKQGLTFEQIVAERNMAPGTIAQHLSYLYLSGENIQINKFINKEEVRKVLEVLQHLEEPYRMREIYEALKETLSYEKIRFALAYYEKKLKKV